MCNKTKLVNSKHLKIFLLISIGLILIVCQFIYSENMNRFYLFAQKELFKEPSNSNKTYSNKTNERYQLMEKYEQDTLPDSAPFKRILFWNDYFGVPDFFIGLGRDALLKWNCPVWQCETSTDRTNVQDYDAVIFHLRSWTHNDLPQRRSPHQRYVAWMMESPVWRDYMLDNTPMMNFYNWTVTYRWDSDMVRPYGYVKPIGNVSLHPSENEMRQHLSNSIGNNTDGKTKMAVWFVSNCFSKSNRNEMVKQLQKYINIDVYGKCGTLSCPKNIKLDVSSEECQEMAAKTYKFHISLENSLCQDYITEKFFYMLHRNIIPIVYGVHDHYDKIAPTHSYINAAKFENMKQLADYLILLDKNDTLYNEYFWWKPYFEVRYINVNNGVCHLCASLHDTTLPPKIYHDMANWWEDQAHCVNPPSFSDEKTRREIVESPWITEDKR